MSVIMLFNPFQEMIICKTRKDDARKTEKEKMPKPRCQVDLFVNVCNS